MFCPGCGKEILADRNFCNICGINLNAVNQILTNHTAQVQSSQQHSEAFLEIEKTRHNLKKLALVLMGLGLTFSIFLMIISEFLREFSWEASRILEHLAPLGGLIIVIGIMTLVYRRLMYGAVNSKVVVLPQANLQQPPIQQPMALPANSIQGDLTYNVPPGRPLFQDMVSNTARQESVPIARQSHDSSYPYPPPTVTEHTTKELKPPQGKHTTNY
jgi:uncharacterized membrane protein YgdD (TMEM256/DUF423 family)